MRLEYIEATLYLLLTVGIFTSPIEQVQIAY